DVEFQIAPFGISGLETALPLTLSGLVEPGLLTLPQAIALMTSAPSRLLGLATGTLSAGSAGDVTVFDPDAEYAIDAACFHGRAKNSPFLGWTVRGRVAYTLCDGQVVYRAS